MLPVRITANVEAFESPNVTFFIVVIKHWFLMPKNGESANRCIGNGKSLLPHLRAVAARFSLGSKIVNWTII